MSSLFKPSRHIFTITFHGAEKKLQMQLATAEKEWKILLGKYRQLVMEGIELRLELEATRFEADRLRSIKSSTTSPPVDPLAASSAAQKRNFDLLEEIRNQKYALRHVEDADNPISKRFKKKFQQFHIRGYMEELLKERRSKICPDENDSEDSL